MYCPECGREMEETAMFCPDCGKAVNQDTKHNNESEFGVNYGKDNRKKYDPINVIIGLVAVIGIFCIVGLVLEKNNKKDNEVIQHVVSEETILKDVRYALNDDSYFTSIRGELSIIDRNTDLKNMIDTIFVQEIIKINQLSIIYIYEVVYGFDQNDGIWYQMVRPGRWCNLIEQKIVADIVGEWRGSQNGESFYLNILECGEDGSISAEFSFPYVRSFQTVQVSGSAYGGLDLSFAYPNYLLNAKEDGVSVSVKSSA